MYSVDDKNVSGECERTYIFSPIIGINEDVKLPGTNIILEKGDKIQIIK